MSNDTNPGDGPPSSNGPLVASAEDDKFSYDFIGLTDNKQAQFKYATPRKSFLEVTGKSSCIFTMSKAEVQVAHKASQAGNNQIAFAAYQQALAAMP